MTDPYNKILFYGSVFILNICVAVLVWLLGPFTLFKPQIPSAAAVGQVTLGHKAPGAGEITAKPIRLVLPSLGIDLPVEPGVHNLETDQWTLGDGKAFHAEPSAPINNITGGALIYGHDNVAAFANLFKIRPSDELTIYTDKGRVFHYAFVSSREVSPDDLSIFDYRGPPIVTLQTCSGSWSQHRQLFEFQLKSVDKS